MPADEGGLALEVQGNVLSSTTRAGNDESGKGEGAPEGWGSVELNDAGYMNSDFAGTAF
jgi:hypothetical protein